MTVPYTFATATSSIPLANLDVNFAVVSGPASTYQNATASQTVFTVPTYFVGTNSLKVYVNGSKQINTLNYNETNSVTVTFVSGLNAGDVVEFTG